MKTISYVMTLIVILFTTNVLLAQEYKIPVDNSKEGKLSLNDFMGDLPIEGYNGTEIIITSVSSYGHTTPDHHAQIQHDRAKGLKPIYPNGTDNTGLGLYVEKNGTQITVQCLLPITKRGEYKIKVPDNFSLKVESGCERTNSLIIQNMKNEIEITNCHSINLKNVTGPLVLSTISGGIDIVYSSVNIDKPVSINSVSGDIDITLPLKTAANLEMQTVSGTIYSDFDFPSDHKQMKQIAGHTIKCPLNGGGVDFKIMTVSGSIYLRKGK
jgi:lia operon protein LiaG